MYLFESLNLICGFNDTAARLERKSFCCWLSLSKPTTKDWERKAEIAAQIKNIKYLSMKSNNCPNKKSSSQIFPETPGFSGFEVV